MQANETAGGAMKRWYQGLVMVGLVLLLSPYASAFLPPDGYVPGSGINGTVHDLGTAHNNMDYTNPNDPLNRICIFCHAPHNTYRLNGVGRGAGPEAPPEYDYLPLWNHLLPNVSAYTMYENGDGAPDAGPKASQAILLGMTPGSTSLLCLSCHDGSVAVNSYGNTDQRAGSQSAGTAFITTSYMIGKDKYLGNHHPIGFNYVAAQEEDPEIRDPDTAMLTPTTFVKDHLYGDFHMECGTCHAVHNKGNTGEALLWRSDQNSELCLSCHDKGFYTAP
jgi:predicted CXXCH cytochrome family protein